MKNLIVSSIFCLFTITSFPQLRVLYFNDYNLGTDQMAIALANQGCVVYFTDDNSVFLTEIATPSNYDLAIYFAQDNSPDLTSVQALVDFVNLGKKGMYTDWTENNSLGALVGVNYAVSINQTEIFITDPLLSIGLTANPFTITNPGTGWSVFSFGLTPLAGSTSVGIFTSNSESAIVKSMSGNMIVFGFLADVMAWPDLYENILQDFGDKILTENISGSLCAGDSLKVGYFANGTFNTGNIFTAQLSDAAGSFASPTVIGSLVATVSDTISCFIPAGASYGSAHRIRVVSSDPVLVGYDNQNDLAIIVVDTSVTVNLITLTANGTGTYQWYNCGTNSIIPGADTDTYTATVNGSYAVIVTSSGCTDTSSCHTIEVVNINEFQSLMQISLFPNPGTGDFSLILEESALIEIYNTVGSMNYSVFLEKGHHQMFLDLASGMYLLKATGENSTAMLKLLIQK